MENQINIRLGHHSQDERRTFLQGDLQKIFDALFAMGAIDPVLKADWKPLQTRMENNPALLFDLVVKVNRCEGDQALIAEVLKSVDSQTIQILTMEVAREFAEFADRSVIH